MDRKSLDGCCWAVILCGTFAANSAFAYEDLLGTTNGVMIQLMSVPNLIAALCYISGIMTMVRGVNKLRSHTENPSQTPMSHGLAHMVAGSALVSLPVTASWISNTFAITGNSPTFQRFL